ncbi:hypothetical protein psyc5s11_18890 [Clostridium gelidum]|uniref:Wadjet protein JetD C-terminal domain-containing protein n=1 Tax=Clostridium gelidum TaxID=704125 RepID=A0ABN6IUY5_9CLOT|nr:Wadjet anti-phage system protein JetD domain-containing protein [Clostridium gelidum]BCZ45822.1 hypothetical protein psyc5s11_18890 [Clostridium gelidum]
MKNYKQLLLDKLIDSYESSKIYKGEITRDNKIYFKFNNKNLKEYFDEYNYKYKEEIDIACEQLEKENFIKIHRTEGYNSHIIDKVQLLESSVEGIYKYLKRKEKKHKEKDLITLLKQYSERDDLLGRFTLFAEEKIEKNLSIKKYLDIENIEQCNDILKGIDNVLREENEIFKRNFSIKVYGDSKKYAHIESRVIKIIKDFSEDEIPTYNIIDNYTYVYFKGNIDLKLKNSNISANDFIGGIAISSKDIENINEIKVCSDKLVTIENLTSFNNYNEECGVIYLGGYHNKVRQKFLSKIYEQNPNINYYHFGDIDAGGFKILVHLINKTKIQFKALNMDSETLLQNIDYAKPLTTNDIIEINRLLENDEYKEYSDVLSMMLKLNKKLEQEIIF